MEFENKKLRDVADIAARIMMGEKALHPNQQKLDVHEPEKDELTAKDFEKLRNKKKMKEETEEVAEEIEQIDELSNDTLKSYVKGAKEDRVAHKDEKDSALAAGDKETAAYDTKRIAKRSIGIHDAKKKMNKEEIDQAAETILEYESKDGKFVHRARPGVYGGTKDEKHVVDTLKGPSKSELEAMKSKKKKMSEMVATYKEQGLKGLFEALKKEEVIVEEPTSAEFDAQLADAKERAAGTKKQAEVSKPAVQAVQNEETHTTVEFIDYNDVNGVKISEIDLTEKKMTPAETKKKEEIVKSMKKGISGFKERYGKDAKSVMYATATKQAMKSEAVEHIEEASDAHQAGYNYTHETIEDAQSKAEVHRHHRAIQADNPHPKGSQEHKDWTAGTDKAKDDHLKDWS
jgi:hypothetical protein